MTVTSRPVPLTLGDAIDLFEKARRRNLRAGAKLAECRQRAAGLKQSLSDTSDPETIDRLNDRYNEVRQEGAELRLLADRTERARQDAWDDLRSAWGRIGLAIVTHRGRTYSMVFGESRFASTVGTPPAADDLLLNPEDGDLDGDLDGPWTTGDEPTATPGASDEPFAIPGARVIASIPARTTEGLAEAMPGHLPCIAVKGDEIPSGSDNREQQAAYPDLAGNVARLERAGIPIRRHPDGLPVTIAGIPVRERTTAERYKCDGVTPAFAAACSEANGHGNP